jgi:hypothetical protein
MKPWLKWLLCAVLWSGIAHAGIDTYEFADQATRERFTTLTKELRCPKCQNQDLADSNAPIAMDLRREIYRMLQEGNRQHPSSLVWPSGFARFWRVVAVVYRLTPAQCQQHRKPTVCRGP